MLLLRSKTFDTNDDL